MNTNVKDFFPYGVSYYRPVTPLPENWDKDLKNISECGFNTIRVSAFWSRIEKEEGKFDFSEFDSICSKASSYNLKVLMTLYIVNMPEWMFVKYPDSRMVSAAGRVEYSEHHPDAVAGGWPGLCMDRPEIMGRVKAFIKEITLHYKGNDTILAFDVIHEPWEEASQEYYIDSWKNSIFCYCDHSIAKFKIWLEKKYKNLEALNKAWSRCYTSWDQVQPPRNFGAYADWLDWRYFSVDALTEESITAGQAVKQYDRERLIVNHCGGVLNAFASSADSFALANTVDIPGASNYSIKSPQDAGMSCDFLRSASPADGDFWIGETSGGSGPMFSFIGEDIERFFAFGMPWSKEIQRKHIYKMLSHGARGIMYWMWRPEIYGCETAAMGFTDREGDLTPRVDNARDIANVINSNRELFLKAKPGKIETAILYNRNTSILEGFAATAKSTQGNAGLFANYKDLWSLSGLAKICMDNSIPVDYVNDELIESGKLEKYKLLILPYSICIGAAAASKIREFVNNGGTVVADALCGYFKTDGWGSERVPAYGLDELFGCKVLEYGYALNYDVKLSGTAGNSVIRSSFVKEKLSVTTGTPIGWFEDGSTAVVVNKYGKGTAIYFGAPLFMHAKNNTQANINGIVSYLYNASGISRVATVDVPGGNDGVEVRILEHGNERLMYVMNHGSGCFTARITLDCISGIECITDLETERLVEFSMIDGAPAINIEIDTNGVRVYKIITK